MTDLLPQHSRYDYIPLPERRDYSWPEGKRLAFVMTTNIEWFAYGAGLGHDPAKTGEPQTHRNYSWRDYGNRIGIWRLFDLLDELALPASHNCNTLLYRYAPQIMKAVRARGDEVVAHGRTNAENLRGMWEPDEARLLKEVTDTIAEHEGKPPAGWMGSGAYETGRTPDLLKELGYKYLMTGRWTTSQSGCARARARSSRCPTRSNSTIRRWSSTANRMRATSAA
jgi:allantoinase